MKILVTGAAGFIGSHTAEKLSALGHEVVGLDAFTDYYDPEVKRRNAASVTTAGATLLELDLVTDDLAAAVEGVEIVVHFAAQPGISATTPFTTYVRNNLIATERLLEVLRPGGELRLFVNIATSSVYGKNATDPESAPPKPTSVYGVTKLAAEQLALSYDRLGILPATSLRIFSVYGERERPEKLFPMLIRAIDRGERFPLFAGSENHSRSYTYVRDIVDGVAAVLDHVDECRGEILNLGCDVEITTGEAIRIVERIMGRKAEFERLPPRAGDQLRTHASIEKAAAILGYRPTTPPEEGLRRSVEYFGQAG